VGRFFERFATQLRSAGHGQPLLATARIFL